MDLSDFSFWQNWQPTMRASLQKGLFFKYCLTD